MSIRLSNLLDIEKYLLAELVYYSPSGDARFMATPDKPMTLAAFLAQIESCVATGHFVLEDRAIHDAYLSARRKTLEDILRKSENLKDAVITGYINDNLGAQGNTRNRWKSSLVAMAFRDSEGNGLVSVSGCEMCRWSSVVIDWVGCGLSFVGIVTPQHVRALRFFDEHMRGLRGEHGVIGHSKGGNVATYIYIKRLSEHVGAYCINAQPYCWLAMTREQKAALKSEQYEFISHTKDFARKFGYVSYISRTVPLSRYAREGGVTSHGFCEVRFDEFGNLEGERVLRETKSRLKSIVFGDSASEKRHGYEESLSVFRAQMKAISSAPRLLSVGLEEIMLTMGAEAATLWIKSEDDAGEYIYPYIVKGAASEALYRLKLRRGGGIAARSAFDGVPQLTEEASASAEFQPGVDRSTGFQTRTMITVPLRAEGGLLGALQILNKTEGVFDERDLALALAMADCVSEVFAAKGGSATQVREFRLMRVEDGDGKELFSIEQNEYRELQAQDAQDEINMLLGRSLSQGDRLVFNRRVFDMTMTDALERMRERDISVIELVGEQTREAALSALDAAMEKRPMLVIASLAGASGEGVSVLTDELRRLCDARTTTVVTLA